MFCFPVIIQLLRGPGARNGKLEKVYATVQQAQQRAIGAVRPGVKAQEVDAVARETIAEAGFGRYFVHGLGHGIGLQVHEAPAVRANSTDVLQAGNVVTIEPGIYLPGWGGIRLEDDVLVTEDGSEVLTSVPGIWKHRSSNFEGWGLVKRRFSEALQRTLLKRR